MTEQPALEFKSHIEGKNADVTIWPDRIEWSEVGRITMTRLAGAAVTAGRVGMRKGSDTNVLPIKAVQGVMTHKGGIGYTTVEVVTGGDRVSFRVSKSEAERVKDTILRLMREPSGAGVPATSAGVPPPASPPTTSVADELKKLAELRDAGVLSPEEFEVQKARLLS